MSYFDGYINLRGERTLRAYSRPVSLARFDRRRPGCFLGNFCHLVCFRHVAESF